MTLEEHNAKLQTLASQASQKAREGIVVSAGYSLLGAIKNRIIKDGKNSSGAQIGTYSTKPAYYPRGAFIKKGAFKPQGKNQIFAQDGTRNKKIKRDKGRKTMYLPEGYKELRQIQGRESGFVNLEYSGDLMLSYQGEPTDTAMLLGFTKESQLKKKEGLEGRYGDVFHATKEEIDAYNKEVIEETNKLTVQLLQGNV